MDGGGSRFGGIGEGGNIHSWMGREDKGVFVSGSVGGEELTFEDEGLLIGLLMTGGLSTALLAVV